MLAGVLLDTHTLYWLVTKSKPLTEEANIAIGKSQEASVLFVSPISAWELSIATQKPLHRDPPQLSSSVPLWFGEAIRATSAKIIPINQRIAIEAAKVPLMTGHKDPSGLLPDRDFEGSQDSDRYA